MHTLIVFGGGFVLQLGFALLGHAFGAELAGMATGAKAFIPVWLICAGVNMWIGVRQAGYSVADETPIFLTIFGVPALAAGFVWWKFSRLPAIRRP